MVFGRKKKDAGGPGGGGGVPLTFGPDDLPRLEGILDGFLGSVGTQRLEVYAQQLALAGGIDVERIERIFDLGPDATKRPWRWLVLGTETASSLGRSDLVVKASAAVGFWQMHLAPNLTQADWFAMGLDGCPPDAELAIHRLALAPDVTVPADAVLATDANGDSMTAQLAFSVAAHRIEVLS